MMKAYYVIVTDSQGKLRIYFWSKRYYWGTFKWACREAWQITHNPLRVLRFALAITYGLIRGKQADPEAFK